jgi:hypothetical protein
MAQIFYKIRLRLFGNFPSFGVRKIRSDRQLLLVKEGLLALRDAVPSVEEAANRINKIFK